MTMTPEIRQEYNRALAAAIVKNGSPMALTDRYYGWGDYGATQHLAGGSWGDGGPGCEWVPPADPRPTEDEWGEFAGTFEGTVTRHGVSLPGVSCQCGQLIDRTIRWQASVSEMTEAVFVEALAARQE